MKVYIASKANHRATWRSIRDLLVAGDEPVRINSRWIDVADRYTADPQGLDYTLLWTHCIEDVINCDVLICYVDRGETLKGALIEVGVALASNKRIVLLGNREDYLNNGTWLNHPGVEHWAGMDVGESIIELLKAHG